MFGGSLKTQLASIAEEMEAVNRERKNVQDAHAPKLQALSRRWMEVTQRNIQIEVRSCLAVAVGLHVQGSAVFCRLNATV